MKKMNKIALLLAVLAIGNSAQAQLQQLQASKPYTFKGTSATTGGGAVTYQWYRDGQPIAGATDSSYLLPAHLAYGTNVMFKRGVVSSTCPGNVIFTNDVNISFGMVVAQSGGRTLTLMLTKPLQPAPICTLDFTSGTGIRRGLPQAQLAVGTARTLPMQLGLSTLAPAVGGCRHRQRVRR